LAEARNCRRIELYTAFTDIPPEATRTAFRELVRRRAEGTPVAYLTGRREFYSLSFRVTPDVLIPRPETEFLVIAALDWLRARGPDAPPAQIIDIGTGSGIIAVCLAKHASTTHVMAVDISPAALEMARGNATEHGVAERIDFLGSDLFAAVPADRKFDLIVSNPPYITTAEMADLAPDVRNFEPHLALEAGPDGTAVIKRLIPQAAERLTPGGKLLIEISPQIEKPVRALFEPDGRWELGPTIKDLAGLARVIQGTLKGASR
jgi:release factor glutamine methyltransferase